MVSLKSTEVINSKTRISSLDFFRCIAILMVMLFHFDMLLPFGFIGVDLFFLISGILVGGILIRENDKGNKINFWKFFIQRGFKIWPSYYLYIFLGHYLKHKDLSFQSNAKYIFFYQNYTGESSHLWSLCVEEHFYILLPFLFIFIQLFAKKQQKPILYSSIILLIIAGIAFKFASYYLTNSQDTYSATHNRIDGLAWGVLLGLQISEKKIPNRSYLTLFSGLFILIGSLFANHYWDYFHSVLFHSFIALSFYLLIKGVYYIDFSQLKLMRYLSYYSYNIFIWHDYLSILFLGYLGTGFISFSLYMILAVLTGVIFTIAIEEPFLNIRKKIFQRKT